MRAFKPATEPRDLNATDKIRANHIVDRILALDPATAASQLAEVLENFQGRHRNLLEIFEARADEMEEAFAAHVTFTRDQRRLVGAYFLHEYSFEAAALFNPSIVAHPDQSRAPEGGRRFILSLRAVGEGHVSSLTFRSGSITAGGNVTVDPSARLASTPVVKARISGANGDEVELVFGPDEHISERVIFPVTQSQSNGIEDARFVRVQGWRQRDVLRDLHRLQWAGNQVGVDRDARLCVLPDVAPDRRRREEQGHGPVSPPHWWPVRHDRAA